MEASLQENGRGRELPSRAVPTATEESTVWNPDNVLAKECVQQRLACSVGDSPTGAKVRSPVTWVASAEETKRVKPIDKAIVGWRVSHQAVTQVNPAVASTKNRSGGRAPSFGAKATWRDAR